MLTEHRAWDEDIRNSCTNLFEKPEGKASIAKTGTRWV